MWVLEWQMGSGCWVKGGVTNRSREKIPPALLCSHETPPAELTPALGPSTQERCGAAGATPKNAMEMMLQGVEPLCSGDRLKEVGLFNLENRRS